MRGSVVEHVPSMLRAIPKLLSLAGLSPRCTRIHMHASVHVHSTPPNTHTQSSKHTSLVFCHRQTQENHVTKAWGISEGGSGVSSVQAELSSFLPTLTLWDLKNMLM